MKKAFDQMIVFAEVGEMEQVNQEGILRVRLLRWNPFVAPSADFRKCSWVASRVDYAYGKGISIDLDDLRAFRGAVDAAIAEAVACGFLPEDGNDAPAAAFREPAATPSPAPVNARSEVSDEELLAMERAGLKGKDIAATTGLSGPTISRRLKKLRATAPEISPEISRNVSYNSQAQEGEASTSDLLG
jgi:hypothetical protein